METVGLLLSTSQIIVELSEDVKRQVIASSSLRPLALSVESKAIRSWEIASQLGALAEIPGISGILFSQTLQDLQDIRDDLSRIKLQIENWRKAKLLFLQAPVLGRSLKEVDSKLTHVDQFLRIVGTLGSLISVERTETREILVSALSSFVSVVGEAECVAQAVSNFESNLQARTSYEGRLGMNADFAFAMGLSSYDATPSKVKRVATSPHKIQSAARYFKRACDLGRKDAFRYHGDVFFDGVGVERCYRTAVKIYEKGVTLGDAAAKFALGWCYEFGKGVEESPEKAIELFEQAIDGGCGEAMAELGFLKLHRYCSRGSPGEAYRLVKKAADMDVFAAKQPLAWCYERGIGVERDPAKAFKLFAESFHGGNLLDTVALACCYDTGTGVEKNSWEATKVYEKCFNVDSWESDHFKACFGLRLVRGEGVEKDESRGLALIIDGTKSVSSFAWHALGECYRYGFGVEKDMKRAKEFFREAIRCACGANGIVEAYLALADMFEKGEGVNVDIRRASKYYLEAADRLSTLGQWKAAIAYETGVGMRRNLHKAVFLFEMSANSGHRGAQLKRTSYYMLGHGVERPRVPSRKDIEEAIRTGRNEARQWSKPGQRRFGALFRSNSA